MANKPNYQLWRRMDGVMLIIDPQKAFGVDGAPVQVPGVEAALANMGKAARAWNIQWKHFKGVVITTRHFYDHSHEVGNVSHFIPQIGDIMAEHSPWSAFHDCEFDFNKSDIVLKKTEFNAFSGTKLDRILCRLQRPTLVIAGLTTPICIESTVRSAHQRGFNTIVLSDACASQAMGNETAEQAHQSAIGRMGYVFSQIMTTDEFIENIKLR